MKKVVIVNYAIGNILSVKRAFEHCDADVTVTNSISDIASADRIVVPGVGAFNNCVSALEESNLKTAVIEFAQSGKPYLGICVGMQMLLDESEEFGTHAGLGLIAGNVTKISDTASDNSKHKVPFVGWKSLAIKSDNPLLKNISEADKFYFVHSYKASPNNSENLLASYKYDNLDITATIGQNNIFGTQFHPEKSSDSGLKVIKNFLAI